jgi:hypothetical protein
MHSLMAWPKSIIGKRRLLNDASLGLALALFAGDYFHCLIAVVTDRRNRAGDGRPNEATQSSPETQFRMVSRMRFFA